MIFPLVHLMISHSSVVVNHCCLHTHSSNHQTLEIKVLEPKGTSEGNVLLSQHVAP